MPFLFSIYQELNMLLFALLLVGLWDLVWKGIGLWYAAKYQQRGWFIVILVISLAGLLPIIYLLWFKPKEKTEEGMQQVSVRRRKVKRKVGK